LLDLIGKAEMENEINKSVNKIIQQTSASEQSEQSEKLLLN
jgi:hypothetical protein